MSVHACANVAVCVCAFSACIYSYVCMYSYVCALMCVLYVGVLKCASAVRAGYKSGERDNAGQPHLELQTLQVGSFMC